MQKHDEELAQLTTRIPNILRREVKLHCVKTETALMQFVARALRDKLDRVTLPGAGRGRR